MTAMVHDLGWRHFPDAYPARGRRWHESALARAIERCSKLFVPSQLTADDLIKEGVSANDIVIAPLGCDHLPAENVDAARRALASKGIDGDYMLAVGTLEPRKNLQRLITAYAQAAPNLPTRFPLVIVGPEGWGEALQPQDGVVMFGAPSLDVLAALYARCRLFVSVPLLEGFGLPVLEAMSKGVPVVSSAVPSAGTASYLVDPLDIDEIAAALVRVVTDEQLRAELIANGTKHALRHTWAACAWQHMQQWEALCDDLTG